MLGLGLAVFTPPLAAAAWRGGRTKGNMETMESWWQKRPGKAAEEGRLLSRPSEVKETNAPAGRHSLKLGDGRDCLLYVPAQYKPANPAPLVLMLHGAGGDAPQGLSLLGKFADESGFILLAPASRRQTWDVIVDAYGPDVELIDRALEQCFRRYAVRPSRVAVGGFSDGASYALSLGLTNGDLFTHVLAFSPGFMVPAAQKGKPHIFISHGTNDRVLPIERCSRRLVPQVKRAGYDVLYREFEGPHTVPPGIAREAVEWFMKERE
jgi:predicted esterase